MTFATRNVGAARVGIAVLVLFLVGMAMAALIAVAIPPGEQGLLRDADRRPEQRHRYGHRLLLWYDPQGFRGLT